MPRTPRAELAERLSAWGWRSGVGVLVTLTLLVWYGRRADAAPYRLLGMNWPAIVFMHTVESIAVVLLPVPVGCFAGLAWGHDDVAGVWPRSA